jgi:3-methyladenine DNA glycosylase AlkD
MNRSQETDRLAREIESRLAKLPNRTAASMRAIRRQYSERLAGAASGFVIQLSVRLLEEPDPFCRFVAYELVRYHRPAFENLRPGQLLQLGEGINSWSSVDGFACYLAGPTWHAGRLPDLMVLEWTQSTDCWWRRAALVSTVALSRRGTVDDVRRTLEVCAALVSDRDDMVVKAMSWALRELSKRHPEKARKFLGDHRRNLAARVIREVENKLATGLKNPRRRV